MKLQKINKTYKGQNSNLTCALNEINLELGNKGLVFILGKSGSGKSTLLNLLAGLDSPTSGKISDELCISDMSPDELNIYRKNNVGFIFQNYNLINELNVIENILIDTNQTQEQIKKAETLLEKLDLHNCKDKNVTELSGGQQQRVAIARALLREKKIILADEPTGNLDLNNSRKIYDIMKDISKERLVIVVSHDQESAYKYGDRIIVLSDGNVAEDTKANTPEVPLLIDMVDKKEFLPTRIAIKLANQFMKVKKVKLGLGAIMMAFTLALLGLMIVFFQYNFSSISASVFQKNNTKVIGIGKGYTDINSGKFILSFRVIDQPTVESISKKLNTNNCDKKYLLQGMLLSASSTGNSYIPSSIPFAIASREEGLKKYGFSIESGNYPNRAGEIAVTDYLAYCIYVLHPDLITERLGISEKDMKDDNLLKAKLKKLDKSLLEALFTSNWNDVIDKKATLDKIRNNPGILLLNSEVDFVSNKFRIRGIVETHFEEKYKDLIYMSKENLREDSRNEEFNYLYNNFYCNFYVSEKFLGSVYKDFIIFDNCTYIKYSACKDDLGLKNKLKDTEAYLSSNYFRSYYKTEFKSESVGKYKMPNEVYIPLGKGMKEDIIYKNKDFNVTGVFDMPAVYENKLNKSQAVVVSDEFFDQFVKAQTYCSYAYAELIKDSKNQTEFVDFLKDNDLYYITNSSSSLYQLTQILNIFRDVFKVICLILALFAVILITNYFSALVTDKKREIGIMRAIGMSKRDINKIFIFCGAIMSVLTIVLSYILLIAFTYVSNELLVSSYLRYIDKDIIKGLEILNLSPYPFLIMPLISLLLLGISIVYPIRRISKLNIIVAIRRNL